MPYLVLIAYAALLFLASVIPDTRQTTDSLPHLFAYIPPTLQNMLHIPAYALLAWLWSDTLRKCHGVAENPAATIGMLVAVSYGIAMEIVQLWVPGRFPSVMDAGFNLMGAGAGSWTWRKTRLALAHASCAAMPDEPRA